MIYIVYIGIIYINVMYCRPAIFFLHLDLSTNDIVYNVCIFAIDIRIG